MRSLKHPLTKVTVIRLAAEANEKKWGELIPDPAYLLGIKVLHLTLPSIVFEDAT